MGGVESIFHHPLFKGQLLSLLITCTGICSTLLASDGVNIPTFQSLLNYVLLSVIFFDVKFLRNSKLSWWKYFAVSVFDVEGTFLVVLAYQVKIYSLLLFSIYNNSIRPSHLSCYWIASLFLVV